MIVSLSKLVIKRTEILGHHTTIHQSNTLKQINTKLPNAIIYKPRQKKKVELEKIISISKEGLFGKKKKKKTWAV